MFNTFQNSAVFTFRLVPDGPILVRAQQVGIDPGAADIEFQRTRKNGRSTVFLAGSGLKGVLRSYCEQLLRTAGRFCCDPTAVRSDSYCGKGHRTAEDHRARQPLDYPHAQQCSACFTFGSLRCAGRFRLDDAFPADELWEETNRIEVRTGVGIERKSQGASTGVLYDTEVVVGGGFEARLTAENFSLWQLGLVLQAVEDLGTGLVRVGGCKARGMGAVKVESPALELRFLDRQAGQLTGARALGQLKANYGLVKEDHLPVGNGNERQAGLFRTVSYSGESLTTLSAALAAGPLTRYLERRA